MKLHIIPKKCRPQKLSFIIFFSGQGKNSLGQIFAKQSPFFTSQKLYRCKKCKRNQNYHQRKEKKSVKKNGLKGKVMMRSPGGRRQYSLTKMLMNPFQSECSIVFEPCQVSNFVRRGFEDFDGHRNGVGSRTQASPWPALAVVPDIPVDIIGVAAPRATRASHSTPRAVVSANHFRQQHGIQHHNAAHRWNKRGEKNVSCISVAHLQQYSELVIS